MTAIDVVGKLRPYRFAPIRSLLPSDQHIVTTKKLKDDSPATPDLERSLAELEKIVEQLENGDLTLGQSLKQFERGIQLTRDCQTALRNAEQKVEILLKKNAPRSGEGSENDFAAMPFDDDALDQNR